MENKIIKGKDYKMAESFIAYTPEYCPCCGHIIFLIMILLSETLEKIDRKLNQILSNTI